jgi:hypothetical protein
MTREEIQKKHMDVSFGIDNRMHYQITLEVLINELKEMDIIIPEGSAIHKWHTERIAELQQELNKQ